MIASTMQANSAMIIVSLSVAMCKTGGDAESVDNNEKLKGRIVVLKRKI
jgi:hypothetical protein